MAGGPRFSQVEQGSTACGIDLAGRPFCWGAGGSGVIGNGSTGGIDLCGDGFAMECNVKPQGVRTGERFRQIVNNGGITCGLTEAAAVYCWGVYQGGYLGIGVVPDGAQPLTQCTPRYSSQYFFVDGRCATEPVAVAGGHRFRSLAAGAGQVCGATEAGDLLCWARPTEGDSADRYAPTAVPGAPAFTQLNGGAALLCGLTAAGAAHCWGELFGSDGQFLAPSPEAVGTGIVFANVAVGESHACGTTPGGTAYCWGSNHRGQLGDGTTIDAVGDGTLEPVFVAGGHSFRELAAGSDFTCGITFEGETYCWGANASGQLGNGTLTASLVPVSLRF
jgi:alpha-tubulin suppressor-like RCC1 family protein